MSRALTILALAASLAACQTAGHPRPVVPPGASVDEENRILCQEPPSSPWYVPCNDNWN